MRSQLYEGCHPLVTEHLVIERASLGADAGLVGAGQFALQRALAEALHAVTATTTLTRAAASPGTHPDNSRRSHVSTPSRHRARRSRHRVVHVLPGPHRSPAFHPQRDGDVLIRYPFLAPGQPLRAAADWRGTLVGKALPGGTVTASAYAELSGELIDRLKGLGPIDGLWYDIHGAMTVEGVDDAEAELLARIRETVGPDVTVSTSMDLHGNVSRSLVHLSDLITCYRMAPHEDARRPRSAPPATSSTTWRAVGRDL